MRLLLTFITFIFLLTSCKETPKAEEAISNTNLEEEITSEILPGSFAHTVYFWLHQPDNEEHRSAFLNSLNTFINSSKHIVTKHIGAPASTSRDVIDNSYTFSLLLTFKNAEDEAAYQVDPNHLKFIEESNELWSKVLVYDSELIK